MISVIIVHWNGAEQTLACLDALFKLEAPPFNILVCDNHSTDGSTDRVGELLKQQADRNPGHHYRVFQAEDAPPTGDTPYLGLARIPHNLGYAGGANFGLRIALRDPGLRFAWVLNNDIRVTPGALNALLETMTGDPEIGVCQSTLVYADRPDIIQAAGGRYHRWLGLTSHLLGKAPYSRALCHSVRPEALDYVVGASLFFRREALEQAGLLPEAYFLYFEEIAWVRQLQCVAPHFRLGYAPDSLLQHQEGASTGASDLHGQPRHYLADFHYQRNRLSFARQENRWRYPIVHMTQLAVLFNRIRRRQWKASLLALTLFLGWVPGFLKPRHEE